MGIAACMGTIDGTCTANELGESHPHDFIIDVCMKGRAAKNELNVRPDGKAPRPLWGAGLYVYIIHPLTVL